jgi:olfactory receptor
LWPMITIWPFVTPPEIHSHHEPLCLCLSGPLILIISTVVTLLHSLMVLYLSFCTHLEIPRIFCELAQVIK